MGASLVKPRFHLAALTICQSLFVTTAKHMQRAGQRWQQSQIVRLRDQALHYSKVELQASDRSGRSGTGSRGSSRRPSIRGDQRTIALAENDCLVAEQLKMHKWQQRVS
jgi:hypothetical protein